VPVWHAAMEELRRQGKVQVVGIAQELHPDRARLSMQWQRVDWPLLVDALDVLNLETVPITVAVDEYGIVRFTELPMSAAKTIGSIRQSDLPAARWLDAGNATSPHRTTRCHFPKHGSIVAGVRRFAGFGKQRRSTKRRHRSLPSRRPAQSRGWPGTFSPG
jgi:hypothetical protein